MSDAPPKRNYVCRKRYLNSAASQVRATLNFIYQTRAWTISDQEIRTRAEKHALDIEAACWSPHSKLTPESYQRLVTTKTNQLCQALAKQHLTPSEMEHFVMQDKSNFLSRPSTPTRKYPVPIVAQSAPTKLFIRSHPELYEDNPKTSPTDGSTLFFQNQTGIRTSLSTPSDISFDSTVFLADPLDSPDNFANL